MSTLPRSSGILLHPTSLPGAYGIGSLGTHAIEWLDFLGETGTKFWQILPTGPTGYGDSPYQCFSAFAGNPYIISLDRLVQDGLLSKADLNDAPEFSAEQVSFGELIPWKLTKLKLAYKNFSSDSNENGELVAFKQTNAFWLEDFSLFMALKEAHAGAPWPKWSSMLRDREPGALANAAQLHADTIERINFYQYLFFKQWGEVRQAAQARNVQIIGDMPIYIAHDSADAWSNPGLFFLKENGRLIVQAGVPPDYFSPTGQLWGNPIYRWDVHATEKYHWWIERFRFTFQSVDLLRLDHFRGFAGYWEVPAGAPTAESGQWVPGPGAKFFEVVLDALGELPLIAEDLGEITPDVFALRDQFGFSGMRIMQFAFDGDPAHPFLPDNYPEQAAAYTGSHDNQPLLGWYQTAFDEHKANARRYLDSDGENIAWDMIAKLWDSRAALVVAQMQDFLQLDDTARMNYPGDAQGNWTWRMTAEAYTDELKTFLTEINHRANR